MAWSFEERIRYVSVLVLLCISFVFLAGRLVYLFLADPLYFPINTVKISANYDHITREQLQNILAKHLQLGFFGLNTKALQKDLLFLPWTDTIEVARIWPDTIRLIVVERRPVAVWNQQLMTSSGVVFDPGEPLQAFDNLPTLGGPDLQRTDVLHIYEKLSKLLAEYGLNARALQLRDNQAWEISLSSGVLLRLGNQDLETRLLRFCRAYPAVFADKLEQLVSVDLRYARGMAVQWKQTMGR